MSHVLIDFELTLDPANDQKNANKRSKIDPGAHKVPVGRPRPHFGGPGSHFGGKNVILGPPEVHFCHFFYSVLFFHLFENEDTTENLEP